MSQRDINDFAVESSSVPIGRALLTYETELSDGKRLLEPDKVYAVSDYPKLAALVASSTPKRQFRSTPVASNEFFKHFCEDEANPGVCYAIVTGGVSKSTDGGNTWSAPLPGSPEGYGIAAYDNKLIVGISSTHSGKLATSTDGGVSWENVSLVGANKSINSLVTSKVRYDTASASFYTECVDNSWYDSNFKNWYLLKISPADFSYTAVSTSPLNVQFHKFAINGTTHAYHKPSDNTLWRNGSQLSPPTLTGNVEIAVLPDSDVLTVDDSGKVIRNSSQIDQLDMYGVSGVRYADNLITIFGRDGNVFESEYPDIAFKKVKQLYLPTSTYAGKVISAITTTTGKLYLATEDVSQTFSVPPISDSDGLQYKVVGDPA